MKVILTEDVDSLGREGDIKEVKNGLARNFLLPKRLAVRATPGNLRIWEQKSGQIKKRQEQQEREAQSVAEKLVGVEITIPVKVGEEMKLFGSVTSQNIADELATQGLEIDRKLIALDSPIKSLGTYDIKIKLYHEVAPSIRVYVVDEENPVPVDQNALEAENEQAETQASEETVEEVTAETELEETEASEEALEESATEAEQEAEEAAEASAEEAEEETAEETQEEAEPLEESEEEEEK